MSQKKIVILGGGFAGIAAALGLEKIFRSNRDVSITVVDRQNYHLFNSNLYEVATAVEELVDMGRLKKSIALPYARIFKSKKIAFIQGEVLGVNSSEKVVEFSGKTIAYDYLLIAQGSGEEYFNIPGAKEFGIPLKSLPQALKIKNAIEFAIQSHKSDMQKKYVRILVAGGGYTGVELAGELRGLINFLSWKHNYPKEKIEMEVIEASNMLMPGMGQRATKDASLRLSKLNIRVKLLSPIVKINSNSVELSNGERIIYDVLVWTAGVKAKTLPKGLEIETDKKNRVLVNEFLLAKGCQNIFILGDQASVINKEGQPVPQSAQDAIGQGKYLAYALPFLMQNRRPVPYEPKPHGFIVSLGGKWAILNYPPFYFTGFLAYIVHELAHVRYFASLVGLWKALKYVWFQIDLYGKND